MDIIQSNQSEFVGRTVNFDKKRNTVSIVKMSFLRKKSIQSYAGNEVTKFTEISSESIQESSKSTLGTLGGAAIGGALFGGAGAVVGGLSSGNKSENKSTGRYGIEFANDDWVVIEVDTSDTFIGRVQKHILKEMLTSFAQSVEKPF